MPLCNFNCASCPFAYVCVPMAIGTAVVWKRYAFSPMQKKRLASQLAFLFLSNTAFLVGSTGLIYTYFYCWEAPMASMACPIGILEHAAIEHSLTSLIYLAGSITLISMVFGRAACGWACPIGFLQDIIGHKRKIKSANGKKADKKLRYLKYAILLLIAPACYITGKMVYTNICPIGGLTATIPALILHPHGYALGTYFIPKMLFLGGFFALVVLLTRGWCRHLCPVGAMMAPFNKISLLQLEVDMNKCTHCGRCKAVCPMDIEMPEDNRSSECIRCGRCVSACPVNAIKLGFT
ncbi:MAG: 4Fe-4S binding protein [Candidatus Thermoplasmatota archaeon]|nr:4Fe-4S binding protein [Candidatus Thermoplasmatota archaeon]